MEKLEILGMLFILNASRIKWFSWETVLQKLFEVSYQKYLKNSLHGWLYVVVSDDETYELYYFKISQDEGGFEPEHCKTAPYRALFGNKWGIQEEETSRNRL